MSSQSATAQVSSAAAFAAVHHDDDDDDDDDDNEEEVMSFTSCEDTATDASLMEDDDGHNNDQAQDEEEEEDDDEEYYYDCTDDSHSHTMEEEDDDEEADVVYQLLQIPNSHKDQITMGLSDEERQWAINVRAAMRNDDHLANICDYECAQYALACQGDVSAALRRMESIQNFRHTHNIAASGSEEMVHQGLQVLEEFVKQQPGYLLEMDIDPITHDPIHAFDIGAINPQAALDSTHPLGVEYPLQIWLMGWYYIFVASTCLMTTFRRGTFSMLDFHQFGWQCWNIDLQIRFAGEVFRDYPITFRQCLCFNTGSVANLCWSLLKPFYPKHFQKALKLGCKIPEEHYETLQDKYAQPSLQEAYRRLLIKAKNMLQLRAKHEKLFKL